jgi:hypothetical protein
LALASNSSFDLLTAAAAAASETDAILQEVNQQASRRPSSSADVEGLAHPPAKQELSDERNAVQRYSQPHSPAHFLFPSMQQLSPDRHEFGAHGEDAQSLDMSQLSSTASHAHHEQLHTFGEEDVLGTEAASTTWADAAAAQPVTSPLSTSQQHEKQSKKQQQDQPLPTVLDTMPLVLTFPKSDLLGHLKRYYYPFLVAHKYTIAPQWKGVRSRQELLQSIFEHDLLAWIVFQLFGGSAESIMVSRIKTAQITRALTAAKLSKISSSQLDLLLVKIKTALAKEGPAAMALAGLSPTEHAAKDIASSRQTEVRSKTGTIIKKKVGASNGNAQTNSSSSDATFPLFLQLLRQLPRQSMTEGEHLVRISHAFSTMLMNMPEVSAFQRHTIEAAFSTSGVFLRTSYATIAPHLVSPCPLIGPAISMLKKLSMPLFAMEDVDGVRMIWERNSEQLHQIYGFYAISLEARRMSLPGTGAMKLQLSIDNLRELLTDFHIVPQLVDVQTFYRLFRATKLWEWEIAECILRSAKVYLLQQQQEQPQPPTHPPFPQSPLSSGNSVTGHNHHGSGSTAGGGGGLAGLLGLSSSYSLLQMMSAEDLQRGASNHQALSPTLHHQALLVDLDRVPPLSSLQAAVADPADMLGSIGHLSLSYPGFLELLARIAALNVSRLTSSSRRHLNAAEHYSAYLPLTETVENMLHLMDASEAKAQKLSRASRRSIMVRHFAFASK